MKLLKDMDIENCRVLVRVDFNVPVQDGKVTDTTRIEAVKETLDYLVDKHCSIVLMSHRGRPKGKVDPNLSMEPVIKAVKDVLGYDLIPMFSDRVVDENIIEKAKALKPGEIGLLENLRYRPEEKENDDSFAKELSQLGEVFVNDAFGTSHRSHASNVGVSKYLPSTLGFLVQREVEILSGILENPERPFVGILGGAKVSDKIGVIENLLNLTDKLIIVGAMANTFLVAQGYELGKSLVESDKLSKARELLKLAEEKKMEVLLPVDLVVAKDIEAKEGRIADLDDIKPDEMALDIGPKSLEAIGKVLSDAKTVVWNGPAGVFESEAFSKGTFGIAKILANLDANVVIGGGDSAAAVVQSGYEDKMTHISSGGGASLEFLEGKDLPAIIAITSKE